MIFGPRTGDVIAFIETLPTLTLDELHEGNMASAKYQIHWERDMDRASIEVTSTLLAYPLLDQALTAAKPPTLAALQALGWTGSNESGVRQNALQALGALVVLDSVDFESVVVRFRPFRFSRVAIPVQWSDSILD